MANKINTAFLRFCLMIGMLYLVGMAYPQDKTFIIEKGTKTFTLSSTGDQFQWFLNGTQLSETSGVYTATWAKGNYLLSILPFKGGCAGDTMYIALKVLDTIYTEGAQVMFTSGQVEVCPPSDAVPSSQEIFVQVRFYGYTLQPGETYKFSYTIDDNLPVTTESTTEDTVILHIPTVDWASGMHQIKITRLMYGTNFENIVDYTTSKFIPMILVEVKSVPNIGEIEF
ncbi:MAG: hypothetical protein N2662_01080 [Bacteroidales bacterium]|nr:hypothetical protein [Bacteroidales bacterium]